MINNPLVSVIMPCYNCEKYIKETMESLVNQSYQNLEILIIDDCSTDNTGIILDEYAKNDNRIILEHHTCNKKIVYTLNELLDKATGKYIARFDGDDISDLNRIEKQVYCLENNLDVGICGINSLRIDENDKIIGEIRLPVQDEDIRFFMLFNNVIIHPGVLIRKDVLVNEYYDENFLYVEDYELWCRLLFQKKVKAMNLDDRLIKYRVYKGQTSSKNSLYQMQKPADVIKKYNMIDAEEAEIHNNVFYLRNKSVDKDTINYILKIYNRLLKYDFELSCDTIVKIFYFLFKKKKYGVFMKLIFKKYAIKAIFRYLLK